VIEPIEPEARRSRLWIALRLASVALVAGLLGLLIWRVATEGRGSDLVAKVRADKKPLAPDFNLKVLWPRDETWPATAGGALTDGKVSLGELRGFPVVLNFWASWCIPCKAEAPRFRASARAHRGEVVFLGVDVQDFSGDARNFLRRFRTNYVSVRDGSPRTYSAYGLTGLPETYFLDPVGRIVAHSVGEVSRRELEQGIAKADTPLASGPPPGPYRGSEPPAGIRLPNFALRDYRGRLVRARALQGKVVLVTFLDTDCTTKCPIIAGQVGAAVRLLSPAERREVVRLAITVNPARDNPASVRRFLRRRHALGELDFLLGSTRQLTPVWKSFHVLSAAQTGNADIHSADVRVFDRRGTWVSTLHAGVDLTPSNLAHDIRRALGA
jgi:cytochrome c biogenesis protein CcmG, thiol:disulfide interchange protein DsbE